jgi:hypothetical protein
MRLKYRSHNLVIAASSPSRKLAIQSDDQSSGACASLDIFESQLEVFLSQKTIFDESLAVGNQSGTTPMESAIPPFTKQLVIVNDFFHQITNAQRSL